MSDNSENNKKYRDWDDRSLDEPRSRPARPNFTMANKGAGNLSPAQRLASSVKAVRESGPVEQAPAMADIIRKRRSTLTKILDLLKP